MSESGIFRLDSEGRVIPRGVMGLGPNTSKSSPSPSAPQFQRYAQSVVTINQKKYLALPKNSSGAAAAAAAGFRGSSPMSGRSSQSQIMSSSPSTNAHSPANPHLQRLRTTEEDNKFGLAPGVSAEEVSLVIPLVQDITSKYLKLNACEF